MFRAFLLAVVVALMATGCGGDGTGGSIAFQSDLEIPGLDDEVLVAAGALAADVGDDAVFGAVAEALDRGYTVAQLVEAAGKGIVTRDGLIEGVEPAGESFGLILGSDPDGGGNAFPIVLAAPQLVAAAWADPVTADELEEAMASSRDIYDLDVEDADSIALVAVLLHLIDMGYSFDQVVEGVIFGEMSLALTPADSGSSICFALVDGRRKVVMPERNPGGAFIEATVCRNLVRSLVATGSPADQPATDLRSGDGGQTTTSEAAFEAEDPDEIADGTYVGEVVLGIAIPNYSIVASRVEITISDGVADIVMDSTLDAGLEYHGEYGGTDVLVCSAVARMIYTGAGAASATIEIPISAQSIEILSVEGECEDSPLSHFDETEIFIFSATYSDGAFTSQTFEGLYTITARLEP